MRDEEYLKLIALSMTPKVGPVLGKNMISYCGGIEGVFEQSKRHLLKIPGIGEGIVNLFKADDLLKKAEAEMNFISKNNIEILSYLDSNYPKRMLQIDSAPLILYYKGNAVLNHNRTVAIVGTRNPSDYGKAMCEKIVEGLGVYKVLIISGLAYGVDAVAHRKSVEMDIPTLGVMGHGMDRFYPSDHSSLAKKMILNGGIITEFTSGTKPDRENFPMRNRIIAGMSDVVVVIESKRKGGSIITADYANDYNRDVFALPGQVNEEKSEGCNKLIKQNKAHLIESASDIGYIMRWEELDAQKVIQPQLFVELEDDEVKMVNIIREAKEITIDALTHRMAMSPSAVSGILLNLEFKGMVRSLPGKKYALV
jgi:DNA processing protein